MTGRHGGSEARGARAVLVTGGAGFIGANFVHAYCAAHPHDRVVVLDALTYAGRRATLAPLEQRGAITFVHGDITDAPLVARLFAEHDVAHVVNFAAESHVDRSIAAPDAFIRTNVWGTHVLLEAARAAWCQGGTWRDGVRYHQISTDEVYGALAAGDAPFTEQHAYRPSSPYSASKAAADHLVRAAGRTYGLPYSISHCANNYGPYQYPEKLIPFMVQRALTGAPLTLYGDGRQTREWVHVHDHNAMLLRVLDDPRCEGLSLNLGGQMEQANADVVKQLCAQLDTLFADDPALVRRFPDCPAARGVPCASLVMHVADRPGHDRRYALDTTAFVARFGTPSLIPFAEGLAETVSWNVYHFGWWNAA